MSGGRGTFATVKEGTNKETKSRVAIKIIDKKDAVFDAESLAQEVMYERAVPQRLSYSDGFLILTLFYVSYTEHFLNPNLNKDLCIL